MTATTATWQARGFTDDIPYADIKAWRESPEHQAAEAAWLTDNPRPPAPWEK